MKNVKLLIPAFTLAAASSLSLAAQQTTSSPAPDMPQPSSLQSNASAQSGVPQQTAPETQSPSSTQSPTVAVPSTAGAPAANSAELRPVTGELIKKIDSKNAKAGDEVVVKTTENATFADGIAIPKGSKIMGHVTDVQSHDKTNENSKLTIQFDQAELKGGQTLPIKSVLQSLSPAPGSDAAQSSGFGASPAPSSPSSYSGGGAAPGGSSGSGSTGSMGNDRSAPMAPQAGTAAPSAGSTAGTTAAPNAPPAAGTVVAHQGNVDIRTTEIPGVLIAAQSNGQPFSNAAGALLGARQNIQLDGGTKVTMAIADANNKAGR